MRQRQPANQQPRPHMTIPGVSRVSFLWMGLGLVLVSGLLLGADGLGHRDVIQSAIRSSISLRQVVRIPLVSEKPSGSSVQKVAWSPDGRRLALSLGWGFELLVLDSSTWREVTRIKWKTFQPERDIAFLSNTEIVTQSAENVTNSPMALAIYDSETGRSIREIPRPL